MYAAVVWTLLFLEISPNLAWELYKTQARWTDGEDRSEERRDGGGRSFL